jgi:hypothetical protein
MVLPKCSTCRFIASCGANKLIHHLSRSPRFLTNLSFRALLLAACAGAMVSPTMAGAKDTNATGVALAKPSPNSLKAPVGL